MGGKVNGNEAKFENFPLKSYYARCAMFVTGLKYPDALWVVIRLHKEAQKCELHVQIRKFSTPGHQKWVRVVGEHGICDFHASWVFINRPHREEET